jgi:hypothetical protein
VRAGDPPSATSMQIGSTHPAQIDLANDIGEVRLLLICAPTGAYVPQNYTATGCLYGGQPAAGPTRAWRIVGGGPDRRTGNTAITGLVPQSEI